jgi:hypothetical protein
MKMAAAFVTAIVLAAGCGTASRTVTPQESEQTRVRGSTTTPELIWLTASNLDDLRASPAGERLRGVVLTAAPTMAGTGSVYPPSAFVARCDGEAPDHTVAYGATGRSQAHEGAVWWEYRRDAHE